MAVEGVARAAGAQTGQEVDSRQARCGGPAGAPRRAAPHTQEKTVTLASNVTISFWAFCTNFGTRNEETVTLQRSYLRNN